MNTWNFIISFALNLLCDIKERSVNSLNFINKLTLFHCLISSEYKHRIYNVNLQCDYQNKNNLKIMVAVSHNHWVYTRWFLQLNLNQSQPLKCPAIMLHFKYYYIVCQCMLWLYDAYRLSYQNILAKSLATSISEIWFIPLELALRVLLQLMVGCWNIRHSI